MTVIEFHYEAFMFFHNDVVKLNYEAFLNSNKIEFDHEVTLCNDTIESAKCPTII